MDELLGLQQMEHEQPVNGVIFMSIRSCMWRSCNSPVDKAD